MKEGKQCRYKVAEHHMLKDILLIHGCGPKDDLVPVLKEIIVDSHCGAAILRGADIYAPGVMAAHPGKIRFHLVSSGVGMLTYSSGFQITSIHLS